MAEPDAGTQLTLLDGTGPVDQSRLTDLYRYPEGPQDCWVRSNFIASLDGAATADGKSGGLGGPGDRSLFALLRQLADVVVVGAGTVRTENYGGAKIPAAARQARLERGQAEVPPIAIVTRSGRLDPQLRVFTDTEVAPLVLTCGNSRPATAAALAGVATVLDCSAADRAEVDIPTALATLVARGLTRVLTEGGPQLHAAFLDADLLDELCLTVAPVLVGGAADRISTGPQPIHRPMTRAHLLTDDDGYLYARYLRTDEGVGPPLTNR